MRTVEREQWWSLLDLEDRAGPTGRFEVAASQPSTHINSMPTNLIFPALRQAQRMFEAFVHLHHHRIADSETPSPRLAHREEAESSMLRRQIFIYLVRGSQLLC